MRSGRSKFSTTMAGTALDADGGFGGRQNGFGKGSAWMPLTPCVRAAPSGAQARLEQIEDRGPGAGRSDRDSSGVGAQGENRGTGQMPAQTPNLENKSKQITRANKLIEMLHGQQKRADTSSAFQ